MYNSIRQFVVLSTAAIGSAALLRWLAVTYELELPSQIGTMILFAPFLACIAGVAWQPYSGETRPGLESIFRWTLCICISTFFFFVWNWIFHDGIFNRTAIKANAYHWIVFFCIAWIGLRAFAAICASWFSPRLKPYPVRLIDLFIALSLAAIAMACFRVNWMTPDYRAGALYWRLTSTQLVHAAWGAVVFCLLWIGLSWAASFTRYRVLIVSAIVIATAAARTIAPYANAELEGWVTNNKIVISPSDTPPDNVPAGRVNYNVGARIIFEERFIRIPTVGERGIEAVVQVVLILVVIAYTTTKSARICATRSHSSASNLESIDSSNLIDGLPNQL
jgi:hypothetical protein